MLSVKRKRWIWGLLLAVLVIAAGSYAYLSTSGTQVGLARDSSAGPTPIPQAIARRGDLIVSISGSGELVPDSTSDLSFGQSGTLLELDAAVGDQVTAGETIARLKSEKTPDQHQADLASARLAVIQAQQALDQINANASLASAQALRDLETSQTALEDLNHPETRQAQAMQAVAEAGQSVADAQMNLYTLQSMPSQDSIDTASASLMFKEKDYQEVQKSIYRLENQIKSAPSETARDRLEAQLIRAQIELARQKIELDNARYKLDHMGEPPDPDSLKLAQDQLTTAQAELEQARQDLELALSAPSPADLAEAQAQLADTQSAWESLKDGPDPVSLQQAQAQLALAQANLTRVQQEELVLELRAPYDGTILTVNAVPGDRIKDTTIVTLANFSQLMVEVSLDETDLPGVRTGLEAQVVFDALPDKTFTGQVVEIDPSLQRFGNTNAAQVLIQMNSDDNNSQRFLLGMGASVDIRVGQAANAVLIPVDALHRLENGDYVVYVIKDNQLQQRPVTIGLMDLTVVEVSSGLQAGEAVATGTID